MSKSITEHLDPSEQRRMTTTLAYHQTFCIQHLQKSGKLKKKSRRRTQNEAIILFILATIKLKLLSLLQKWRNKGYEAF